MQALGAMVRAFPDVVSALLTDGDAAVRRAVLEVTGAPDSVKRSGGCWCSFYFVTTECLDKVWGLPEWVPSPSSKTL